MAAAVPHRRPRRRSPPPRRRRPGPGQPAGPGPYQRRPHPPAALLDRRRPDAGQAHREPPGRAGVPHRSIEVYLGGTHLCTAYPAQRLSPEQTEAFLENAARERKRLTAERRKASARTRAELAPLSRGETRAEESRVLPPHAGDELAARRGDALLRRKARGSAWTCPGCTAMTAGTAPTSA